MHDGRRTEDNKGQQPIAMSHMSDSVDLIIMDSIYVHLIPENR